jgi:hypothetical protein
VQEPDESDRRATPTTNSRFRTLIPRMILRAACALRGTGLRSPLGRRLRTKRNNASGITDRNTRTHPSANATLNRFVSYQSSRVVPYWGIRSVNMCVMRPRSSSRKTAENGPSTCRK